MVLKVALDHIVPLNEARERLNEMLAQTQADQLWVLTENDKPRVAVVAIDFLEQLMRRAWFNELSARSYTAFDDYLRRQGLDPVTLDDEAMEDLLHESANVVEAQS
jgi:PHD/YefM family antitoxin component YafN of YafNO toxin-antitoxin module